MNEQLSKYHPVVSEIIEVLRDNNFWFETFEHEPVRTSEEAAKLRHGYSLHQGAKALILKIRREGKDMFVMAVIPGDARLDGGKVKRAFGSKDLRFASEEEVGRITNGVQVGGVPPFGNLFDLEVVVDPELLADEKIIFNAGDKRFSIAMRSVDYKTILSPRVEKIVRNED